MKIIRSLLILATALGASTALYAQQQQLKPKIAKPIESPVPPPGNRPVLAPDTKPDVKQQPEAELKPMDTKPVAATDKGEEAKPQLASGKDIVVTGSTIAPDKRENAVRPVPIIPAENKNITTTPPAKAEAGKPVVARQQQK
jgi:hypothetical protein